MVTLTVGYVAGIIAFAVYVARFTLPNLIALPLAHFLGDRQSAVTWTVAGKEFQSSSWPWLSRHESASSSRVNRSVRFLSALRELVVFLLTVTAVVTPLGLYERVEKSQSPSRTQFAYVKDTSVLGRLTESRPEDLQFSRSCGVLDYFVCPDTTITPGKVDTDKSVSKSWTEVLESGLKYQRPTVSSALDIQWRRYQVRSNVHTHHKTSYVWGSYSQSTTNLLDEKIDLVEGLIVDYRSGAVGFRNHTVPREAPLGAEWEEDILFVEPETACVDTNLTVEYHIDSVGYAHHHRLVDNGGFVHLPSINFYTLPTHPADAQLRERAFRGAWINNYYTMLYMNVTGPDADSHAPGIFPYMDSTLNKSFKINPLGIPFSQNSISFADFGDFVTKFGPKYPNPWNISSRDFDHQANQCEGGGSLSNITNIAISCPI